MSIPHLHVEESSQQLYYEESSLPMVPMAGVAAGLSSQGLSYSSQGSAQHVPTFRPRRMAGVRGNGGRIGPIGDNQATMAQLVMDNRKLMAQNADLKDLVSNVNKSLSEIPNLTAMMNLVLQSHAGLRADMECVKQRQSGDCGSSALEELKRELKMVQDKQNEMRMEMKGLEADQKMNLEALKIVRGEMMETRAVLVAKMRADLSIVTRTMGDILVAVKETNGDQDQRPMAEQEPHSTNMQVYQEEELVGNSQETQLQPGQPKETTLTLLSPIVKTRDLDFQALSASSPMMATPARPQCEKRRETSWLRNNTRTYGIPRVLTSTPTSQQLPAFIRAREAIQIQPFEDFSSSSSDLDI